MKFEPLATLIEDSMPTMKLGTNLFINMMPATVSHGALLKDSFAGTEIDGEIPNLRRGRFQLAARSTSYEGARALIEEISAILTLTDTALPGLQVKIIRPLHEPNPYMPSVGGLVEFSVNFSAIYGIVV